MNYDALLASLLVGAVGAVSLVGCGGGTECGTDTFERNGKCYSETDVVCAKGTTSDGIKCKLDDEGCGAGTQFDEDAGTCIPSSDACEEEGSETDFVDGRCVAVSICSSETARIDNGKCVPKFECDAEGAVQPNPEKDRCEIVAAACGEGTKLSSEGTCVLEDTACGEGLAVSGESNQCVPDDDSLCVDGLALSEEGKCVPTEEVCGDETTFDEELGLCVPDERCAMGDVVVDGKCLSPAEELAADPDVTESENDDPAYGGSPTQMQTASSTGESTVFTGTIDSPSDLDGDGSVEQDRDYFAFTASEGDWFRLSVQSTGLPQPNLLVTGPEGYRRFADNGVERAAARDIVIPRDGTYRIRIVPHSTVSRPDYDPVGQSDWSYVGSLTRLATPSPQSVDFTAETAAGTASDLTDNLYRVGGFPNGGLVEFSAPNLGADLEAQLSIWSDTSQFETSLALEPGETELVVSPQTSSNDFLVLVDWLHRRGPRDDYELGAKSAGAAEILGDVPTDGSVDSTPRTVSDVYNYVFTVQAGQVVEITQTNTNVAAADYQLHRSNGTVVDSRGLDVRSSVPGDAAYWYAEETTTFYASFTPRNASSLDDLDVRVRSTTPDDLGSGSPGETLRDTFSNLALDPGYSTFARFELTDAAEILGEVETDLSSTVDAKLRGPDFDEIVSVTDRDGNPSFNPLRVESGTVLLQVAARSTTLGEYTADLDLSTAALEETEPNDATGTASEGEIGRRHIGRLEDGTEDYFSFEVPQGLASDEVLQLDVAARSNVTPPPAEFTCRLLDANGSLVTEKDGKARGCALYESGLDSGTYYAHLAYDRASGGIGLDPPRLTDYLMRIEREDGVTESSSNDQRSNADTVDYSSFESGHRIYGELTDSDTEDWYRIDLPSGTGADTYVALDIEMFGPQDPPGASFGLFDSNGQLVARGDTRVETPGGLAARDLSSGTYFLRVDDTSFLFGQSYSGQYWIEFDRRYTPPRSASPGSSLPASIPDDDPNGVTSTVSFSNACTVDRVDVELDIEHSTPDDLDVTLESPDGTTVTLYSGTESSHSDVKNVFPLGAEAEESLSALRGTRGDGDWTLTAADRSAGTSGTLNDWRINLECN